MNEKEIRLVDDGRLASIAIEYLKPFLEKSKELEIIELKRLYADKDSDLSQYVGRISVINFIDKIIDQIQRKVTRANKIEEQVING